MPPWRASPWRPGDADELAIARYRYLLRTAPPETLEAAHAEAFAQLTPEQRRRVLDGLAREVDPAEMRTADDSPAGLARIATRAELRQPGTIERAFGNERRGGLFGGLFGGGGAGGSFFGMLAGAFIGTSIANAMFAGDAMAADAGSGDTGSGDAGAADPGATDPGAVDDGGRVDGGGWDQGPSDPGGFDGGDGGFGGWGDGGGFDGGGFDIGF